MLKFSQRINAITSKDTVLLRVDFNLSKDRQGQFVLSHRFYSMIPVIKQIVAKGCSVIVVSHLGRPKAGGVDKAYSFSSLVPELSKALDFPVSFLPGWPHQKTFLAPGTVAMSENTRFLLGETKNDPNLVGKMLNGVSTVVMEAFACSHRKHASTVGIASQVSRLVLGPCHRQEIYAIDRFRHFSGQRMAVVAGKKITTKLALLEQMVAKMNVLCLGGGIANTLLHSQGYQLGGSFVEYSQLRAAQVLYDLAKQHEVKLILPQDVVVCENLQDNHTMRVTDIDHIEPQEFIIDVGPKTVAAFVAELAFVQSVYWNGPLGIYEHESGMGASTAWAQALSSSKAYTLLGGGDTLSVLENLGYKGFTHVSMGGGAFLHYLAHGTSPVLSALQAYEEDACEEQRL